MGYYASQSAGRGLITGATTGASVGAELGSLVPGGTLIGAGIGTVIGGLIGAISGNKKGKNAEAALTNIMNLPAVDPTQVSYLDELKLQRRAIESGYSTEYQAAKDVLLQSTAGMTQSLTQMAAGNPVAALDYVMKLQGGLGSNMNKILSGIITRSDLYLANIGQLINEITQRKLDVQSYKAAQNMALAANDLSTFNQNANALLMLNASVVPDIIKEGIKNLQSNNNNSTTPTISTGAGDTGD